MTEPHTQTTVLVVDDEAGIRTSLAIMLKLFGHRCLLAETLAEARAHLDAGGVDVVLVDLVLGHENGLDLLTLLQNEHPDTPGIVITGLPTMQTVMEALRVRAFDFLTKPIGRDTLKDAIQSALDGRAARRDGERYRAHLEKLIRERTARLAELERRQHLLTRHLHEVLLTVDRRFRFTFVSESVVTLLGYTPQAMDAITLREILTDDSFDLLLESFPAEFSAGFGTPVTEGRTLKLDLELIHRNGTILPVECQGSVTFFRDGQDASAVLILRPKHRAAPLLAASGDIPAGEKPPDIALDFVLRIDTKADVLYLSPDLPGADDAGPKARNLDALPWPAVLRARIRQGVGRVLETAAPVRDDLSVPTEAAPRIVELRFFPEPGKDGKPESFLVVGRDLVSERLAAQRLQRATEECRRLIRIINRSSTAVFIWRNEPGWPLTFVSDNVGQFGYSPKGLIERETTFEQLIHPDDREWVLRERSDLLARGDDHFHQQYRILTGDGGVIWVEDRTWTRKDADGDITSLEALIGDITQSRSIQQKLQDREEKYLLVTRNINDMIWTISLDLLVTFVSPSVKRLLGYDVWEFYRMSLGQMLPKPSEEEFRAAIAEFLAADRQEGADPNRSITMELPHIRANGEIRWLEVRLNIIRETNGTPAGFAAISRDIQDRKIAELARQNLEDQLRHAQKLEGVGLLASGIAHDFNNLLTGIIGNVGLLEMDTPVDDPSRELMADVRLAGERAAKLSQQLLAVSRRQVVEPHPMDVNRLVRDLNSMFSRIIGENIRLITHLATGLGSVMADLSQMEQVLLNLVVNARDAMSEGGTLTIATERIGLDTPVRVGSFDLAAGAYVRLTVRDTGHGMDTSTMERVFEPFFTTKPKHKGTGLGLSTVFSIVTQHGGAIGLESEAGIGTAFHIYLPRLERGPEAQGSDGPGLSSEGVGGNETILVVEDDPVVRKLATRTLSRLGYTVTAAQNGVEALTMLNEGEVSPDLVVTDLVMPRMNGLELAMRVSVLREGLPILFMSGYTDGLLEGVELGSLNHAFLAKPFTPLVLAAHIREMLDRKR